MMDYYYIYINNKDNYLYICSKDGDFQCRGQSVDTLEAYQRMACADGPSERCSYSQNSLDIYK